LRAWGCDYLQGVLIGSASVAPPWSQAASEAPPASATAAAVR
jgi:hypothetical protein